MNIALIGYRGSGKTSVAECLAGLLQWDWCDADAELESRAGRTIEQIFRESGEAAFRDLESQVLAQLLERRRWVLALGGGVILRPANREQLAAARVVWLRAAPETLFARISGDPTTSARRPNLTAQGGLDEVRRLLAERTPHYAECADHVVETEAKSPQQIAQEIVSLLNGAPPD